MIALSTWYEKRCVLCGKLIEDPYKTNANTSIRPVCRCNDKDFKENKNNKKTKKEQPKYNALGERKKTKFNWK